MLKILNGTFKIKETIGVNEVWLRPEVSQLKSGKRLHRRGST